jgi:hypothetical protein
MYEVAEHFYTKLLPEIVELAECKGRGEERKECSRELLARAGHVWNEGLLSPEEAQLSQKAYARRYDAKAVSAPIGGSAPAR